ncbi:MFS transporter [Pararobbsia silviterrae]|uniref:MFS transporter n=1 Tax=Pararobbsia silviterrae TaxID=1792498 RepID=A0A494YB75_9BURK|nr:MFS transporter [Pararobbsia silviterrae]RKP57895.1 MFS transporter [Pararobbsia silviterrae]
MTRTESRKILWLLSTCCLMSMASMRVCDSLLTSLQATFAIPIGRAAQTISAFALAYGATQLFVGPLGDRFGKMRVVGYATALCTIGQIAAALAQTSGQLIAARVLSGAAAAGIVPLTMAWIGDAVPYARRQEVLAQLLGATVFGMIAGQWFGAVIADALHWRVAFALLAAISLIAGWLVLREPEHDAHRDVNSDAHFVRRARAVLSIAWARTVLCVTFVEGAFAYSALAFVPSYLHRTFGIAITHAGAIAALYGVGGLVYSRCTKRLVARLGEIHLARLGGLCLALAYGGLAWIPRGGYAWPACLLAGFGFYALHNTLQTHATQMAPQARGTAVSLFSCFLFFGQSIGIAAAAAFIGRYSAPPVFMVCGLGLFVLSIVFSGLIAGHAKRVAS